MPLNSMITVATEFLVETADFQVEMERKWKPIGRNGATQSLLHRCCFFILRFDDFNIDVHSLEAVVYPRFWVGPC